MIYLDMGEGIPQAVEQEFPSSKVLKDVLIICLKESAGLPVSKQESIGTVLVFLAAWEKYCRQLINNNPDYQMNLSPQESRFIEIYALATATVAKYG